MNVSVLKVLRHKILDLSNAHDNLLFIIDREKHKLKIIKDFGMLNKKIIFLNTLFLNKHSLSLQITELFSFFKSKTLIFFDLEQTGKIIELLFICDIKKSKYIIFTDKL